MPTAGPAEAGSDMRRFSRSREGEYLRLAGDDSVGAAPLLSADNGGRAEEAAAVPRAPVISMGRFCSWSAA